jgi:Phosphotransferase enzyme family
MVPGIMKAADSREQFEPFAQLLQRMTGESSLAVTKIAEVDDQPRQGFSGSVVRAYSVTYRTYHLDRGGDETAHVVVKNASPLEQQVVQLLTAQNQALPEVFIPEISTSDSMPMYLERARARPLGETISDPYRPLARQVAAALARIHAANRRQCPEWLPRVADDYVGELYLNESLVHWERCLRDNRFFTEFGQYDRQLRSAFDQFLVLMRELTAQGDTLTLINSDLNPDHILLVKDDRPVLIDWEQACYGSFYLDLPNYFSIETVLLYRDALADAGFTVPPADFIDRFREVGRYMGLRHLQLGLVQWQGGSPGWEQGRWFFHYCLTIALRGR